jgi:hypothetical protein
LLRAVTTAQFINPEDFAAANDADDGDEPPIEWT